MLELRNNFLTITNEAGAQFLGGNERDSKTAEKMWSLKGTENANMYYKKTKGEDDGNWWFAAMKT